MCRAKTNGGRRCPSHSDPVRVAERNAVRRERKASAQKAPLSNAQYQHRLDYAYEAVARRVAGGQETHKLYARETESGDLVWDSERVEVHNEIINEILGSWKDVPAEGKAIFSGGLGGAGKSTVLKGFAGIDTNQYATLNPDDVKEVMAAKGLIPTIPGLSPMEASPLVHEEASYITKRLAMKLVKERKNIIYDVTMGSYGSTVRKMDELSEAGYNISAVFVDIPPHVSLSRSQFRHRRGVDSYITKNEGFGGRLLPKEIIHNQIREGSNVTVNREVFEKLRDENRFTEWSVWDNSVDGRNPVKVQQSDAVE